MMISKLFSKQRLYFTIFPVWGITISWLKTLNNSVKFFWKTKLFLLSVVKRFWKFNVQILHDYILWSFNAVNDIGYILTTYKPMSWCEIVKWRKLQFVFRNKATNFMCNELNRTWFSSVLINYLNLSICV